MNKYQLPMDPVEIAVDFKQAANPSKQIRILAQLNATSEDRIAEILREQGIKVDGRWLHKGTRTKNEEVKPMEKKTEATEKVSPVAPEKQADVVPAEDVVDIDKALPVMVRSSAIETIAQLLANCKNNSEAGEHFMEQVRGVLALVHEVETRCRDVGAAEEGELRTRRPTPHGQNENRMG